MNRDTCLSQIKDPKTIWDFLIIGGGATGLGAAVDAASRGYKTLLLEQHDFAKGSSSRSTKLIHGGLRYLRQGNISLVKEALQERGLLCQNAPHLIKHRAFLVPHYHFWEGPFYALGIKAYDLLAGNLGLESSKRLTREETLKAIPNLEPKDLKGGMIYYDGQFDDARLAITLALTCVDLGAAVINYMPVISFLKESGKICGVIAKDLETDKTYKILSKIVINATGIFCDALRKLDNSQTKPILTPSQGIHLVLDRSWMKGDTALLVPHTKDHRVLFIVPWYDRLLVGTTDTPISFENLEPTALDQEIDYLLFHARQYLERPPTRKDILSIFAGLRPLAQKSDFTTSKIPRDHTIVQSESGLITIAGGKWTTYRKMAEDVIDQSMKNTSLTERKCSTHHLKLHGFSKELNPEKSLSVYGSDISSLQDLLKEKEIYSRRLHERLPYLKGEIVWAVRKEMARTVEDVLARRTRALFLDAKASIEIAQEVAKFIREERSLKQDEISKQLNDYIALAKNYLP